MRQLVLLVAVSSLASCKARTQSTVTSIYGNDDRVETHTVKDSAIRKSIQASVMLIRRSNLTKVGTNYQIKSVPLHTKSIPVSQGLGSEEEKVPFCRDGLAFGDQPSAAFCSGALVTIGGSEKIGSAGHCVLTGLDCENVAVVFDYAVNDMNEAPQSVPEKNVYFCEKILTAQDANLNGEFVDFSFFSLDRPVEGREPLLLSSAVPKLDQPIYVIGHPLGVPQKFAPGRVRVVNDRSFGADFDGLNGNSGSPVFDANTHQIFGFWANGSALSYEKVGDCAKIRRCDDSCGQWNMTNQLAPLGNSPLAAAQQARPTLLQGSLARDGSVVRTTSMREGFRAPTLAAGRYDLTLTWRDIAKPTTIRARTTGGGAFMIEGQAHELKPAEVATTQHQVNINPSACHHADGKMQSLAQLRLTVSENGNPSANARELVYFLPCPPHKELAGLTLPAAQENAVAEGKSELLQTERPSCITGKPCSCVVEYRKLWWGEVWRRTYPVKWSSANGRAHLCEGLPRKYKDANEYFFQVVEQGVGRNGGY